MSPEDQTPTEEARTCPQCQGEFTALPASRQVYCSRRCRDQANQPEHTPPQIHTCPVCDGQFLAEPRLRQVYCSPRCRAEQDKRRGAARDQERARRLGETQRRAPAAAPVRAGDPLAPAATRNCPHCDQPITIIALLTTPEAARPHITQPGADIVNLRRA